MNPIDIGGGINFVFKNIFIPEINVNDLEYTIQSNFTELNNSNNQINLTVNK